MSDAYESMVQVLVTHLGLEPETISPGATFEDLRVDSLSLLELAMILEDDYGIEAVTIDSSATLAETAEWLASGASTSRGGDIKTQGPQVSE